LYRAVVIKLWTSGHLGRRCYKPDHANVKWM
jgi:hypothetical protein